MSFSDKWFGKNADDMRKSLNGLQTKLVLTRERAGKFGFEMTEAGLKDVETSLRKVYKYLEEDIEEFTGGSS